MPKFNFASLKKDSPEETENKEIEKVKELLKIEEQKEVYRDPIFDSIFDETDLQEADEIVNSLNLDSDSAQSDEKPTEEQLIQSEKIKPKKKTGKKNSKQTDKKHTGEQIGFEDLIINSEQFEQELKNKDGQLHRWIFYKSRGQKLIRSTAIDQIVNLTNEILKKNYREAKQNARNC